jgi:hypothetical protein
VHCEPVQSIVAADLAPGAVQIERLGAQGCVDLFVTHHDLSAAFINTGHLKSGWHCCGKILTTISVIEQ